MVHRRFGSGPAGLPIYRYGDKPDYDPTRRAWYLAAIHAPTIAP